MRIECCITQLRPFMSEAEYMAVRTRVCDWDLASDEYSYARLEEARKRKAG